MMYSTSQDLQVTGIYYLTGMGCELVRCLKLNISEVQVSMLSNGGSEPTEGNAE